jgi:hypothetical protein
MKNSSKLRNFGIGLASLAVAYCAGTECSNAQPGQLGKPVIVQEQNLEGKVLDCSEISVDLKNKLEYLTSTYAIGESKEDHIDVLDEMVDFYHSLPEEVKLNYTLLLSKAADIYLLDGDFENAGKYVGEAIETSENAYAEGLSCSSGLGLINFYGALVSGENYCKKMSSLSNDEELKNQYSIAANQYNQLIKYFEPQIKALE